MFIFDPYYDCPMMQIDLKLSLFILLLGALCSGNQLSAQNVRNIDGFGNNTNDPELGAAGSLLKTATTVDFSDGIGLPAGENRENPRVISNQLFQQEGFIPDAKSLSDYNWVFGQFIDHDLTLVENASPTNIFEGLVIVPPADDNFFSESDRIFMMRSKFAEGTGTDESNPRRFVNEITSFLDGSAIYGSETERAHWLRSFKDGKLKVSSGNLLPWNTTTGEFNAPLDSKTPFMADDTRVNNAKLFVAGDVRANENPLLIAMHTIFVREHNRNCDLLKSENPGWDDEELYQHAKRITTGVLQSIVYNEWLPAQGIEVPTYRGYNPSIDPSISNVFSAAAFRMGHTLINSNIIRLNNRGESNFSSMSLRDAFFNPAAVWLSGGIDPFLKGMGTQIQQELDCKIIDDVRNFLFGAPGAGGLDLAAININRGRERGLPHYNEVRINFGLPAVKSWEDISSDVEVIEGMKAIYEDVNDIDPWVGMLAEDHMKNAIYGELSMTIIEKQFRVIRDGDRFYYENDDMLSEAEKREISATTLHDVIMRNTGIDLMQKNVFTAMPHEEIPNGPTLRVLQLDAAIYPNPVKDHSTIKVYSERDTELEIEMFDNYGRLIRKENFSALKGDNFVPFNLFRDLPNGAYNIKVTNDLGIFTVIRAVR
ncbi:peroxidase family protein [Portibacter marinus]|uniref:peroxidase family protein n=1 Tax=Portibacter marinus TaxID=2898660 RepID=UPI001F3DC611|nr:peroxidase family protein [Portibacter marinus]